MKLSPNKTQPVELDHFRLRVVIHSLPLILVFKLPNSGDSGGTLVIETINNNSWTENGRKIVLEKVLRSEIRVT